MTRAAEAVRTIGLAVVVHSLAVGAAFFLAGYLPHHAITGFVNPTLPPAPPFVTSLIRWDAHWYIYLAEHGYTEQTIVFFPALATLIKAATYLGLNYTVAGFAVANVFAVASFALLYAVGRLDFTAGETRRALLAFAVMPTSLFLNSVYTEPVFLTFALACVYCSRTGRWWLAGLFAALTTMTRNVGIVLVLLMLYEMWAQNARPSLRTLGPLLAAPAALAGFVAFNYRLTGDPLAFAHIQKMWGRLYGLPWTNIWHNTQLIAGQWPVTEPGVVLDLILVILALLALGLLSFTGRFPLRRSYLIVGWLWLLIPLFSTSLFFPLYSLARFVLVIFPLYLFWARLPRPLFYASLPVCWSLLVLATALFMNWHWLG